MRLSDWQHRWDVMVFRTVSAIPLCQANDSLSRAILRCVNRVNIVDCLFCSFGGYKTVNYVLFVCPTSERERRVTLNLLRLLFCLWIKCLFIWISKVHKVYLNELLKKKRYLINKFVNVYHYHIHLYIKSGFVWKLYNGKLIKH